MIFFLTRNAWIKRNDNILLHWEAKIIRAVIYNKIVSKMQRIHQSKAWQALLLMLFLLLFLLLLLLPLPLPLLLINTKKDWIEYINECKKRLRSSRAILPTLFLVISLTSLNYNENDYQKKNSKTKRVKKESNIAITQHEWQ